MISPKFDDAMNYCDTVTLAYLESAHGVGAVEGVIVGNTVGVGVGSEDVGAGDGISVLHSFL